MFKKCLGHVTQQQVKTVLELDKTEFNGMSKDVCITQLMKKPKKMLLDILKTAGSAVKSTISKSDISHLIYNNILTSS